MDAEAVCSIYEVNMRFGCLDRKIIIFLLGGTVRFGNTRNASVLL